MQWPIEKIPDAKEQESIDKLEVRKSYAVFSAPEDKDLSFAIRLLGWPGLLIVARRLLNVIQRWTKREFRQSKMSEKERCKQYWYRCIQRDCFSNEISDLQRGKPIKKESKIVSLNPFLDEDGILRANGRVKALRQCGYNNQPIILHTEHFATLALIREFHRGLLHGSNNTVLNEIRQNFHIVGLRKALRSISSRCIVCRLQKARPCNPMMANLPPSRLAYRLRSFSHCGLDYFGPMIVTIGRRHEKRWGALFTCLTTRAVHIEIAHSLIADSAIMALQRFSARRGRPLKIYCDNGTNFHRAEKDLKEAVAAVDNEKISVFALNKDIDWQYNPPDAPHMGGAWERLVRSVKTALRIVLKDHAPREEVLMTVLAEVEHAVNSRPLTDVSLDCRDEEALTPNHFLLGTSSGEINLGKCAVSEKGLKKQWKLAQFFADAFWKRWLREYVPTLMQRQKWTDGDEPLKTGDVVLIIDLQAPRNCWRRGEITKIFPS